MADYKRFFVPRLVIDNTNNFDYDKIISTIVDNSEGELEYVGQTGTGNDKLLYFKLVGSQLGFSIDFSLAGVTSSSSTCIIDLIRYLTEIPSVDAFTELDGGTPVRYSNNSGDIYIHIVKDLEFLMIGFTGLVIGYSSTYTSVLTILKNENQKLLATHNQTYAIEFNNSIDVLPSSDISISFPTGTKLANTHQSYSNLNIAFINYPRMVVNGIIPTLSNLDFKAFETVSYKGKDHLKINLASSAQSCLIPIDSTNVVNS